MGAYKSEDGKFRAEAVVVREFEGLRIIFWDADSIYVYYKPGRGVIFQKWEHHPRGFYRNAWGTFRRRLMRRKHLTLLQIHEIAAEYDVVAISTARELDLSKVKVVYKD